MKKSTKVMSLALSMLLAFGGFTACGGGAGTGGSGTKVDEKTIVVKVRKAGFGTDWLSTLKQKFETVYSAEGYKVKILQPDNSIKDDMVVRELARGYNNIGGVDLYITSGVTPDTVGVNGDYGVLVEDLSDIVYNQKAIDYSGNEEAKTVEEKIDSNAMTYMTASTGEKYAYCWAQTSGGLVVNTTKLAKYGLEIPKTTNEMFDCFEKIYLGHNGVENSAKSSTYPITYVSGSNGYTLTYLWTLLAQYDANYFDTFYSFQNADGTQLSNEECKDIYNDPAMKEMVEVAYRTFDLNLAAPGSTTQAVDQAQAKIMSNGANNAVFMFNGDWMLNEVKMSFKNYLHDIDFVNYPVTSALGVKLFGEGTSYNLGEAECDSLLSTIVGYVDQNLSIDEIISNVYADTSITLSDADAREVARARGVTYSRGMEHVAYVTKGTPKKDIVGLFLRMMSSDDFGKTFNEQGNGATPYCAIENTTSEYKFVNSASKIVANQYFSFVSTFGGAKGYKGQLNMQRFFYSSSHLPIDIATKSKTSIYTMDCKKVEGADLSVYATAAETFLNGESIEFAKEFDKAVEKFGN